MHMIEFQKRGLLHAHILIILHQFDKPQTPDNDNTIISTEISDRCQYVELYETVANYILHGPCGPLFTDTSCMKNGKYSKKFPRNYNETTTLVPDSFSQYRHRDSTFIIKGNK